MSETYREWSDKNPWLLLAPDDLWAKKVAAGWGAPRDPWEKRVFEGWDGDMWDNDWLTGQCQGLAASIGGTAEGWHGEMHRVIGEWPGV